MEDSKVWSSKYLYEAVDEWLVNYKKRSIKPASYDRLRTSYNLLMKYKISRQKVCWLKVADMQKFVNALADDGYSASTIHAEFTLLTAYLKHAFANGDIETPIYIGVKIPASTSIKKAARKVDVYSSLEQMRLMNEFKTYYHRCYVAGILMLECGLRVGEALALTWGDIDWNRKSLRINKTIVRLVNDNNRMFVQSGAKSKTSNRTIPLSKTAMEALQHLLSPKAKEDGYLFYSDENPSEPVGYATIKYYLKRACKAADVRYCGCHIFRHTFVTNCYNKGADVKILSKLVGHADVAITYNTYIHLFGDALEEMRKIID